VVRQAQLITAYQPQNIIQILSIHNDLGIRKKLTVLFKLFTCLSVYILIYKRAPYNDARMYKISPTFQYFKKFMLRSGVQ
jgi:hypothetical protein